MAAVQFWDTRHGLAGAGEALSACLLRAGSDRGSSGTALCAWVETPSQAPRCAPRPLGRWEGTRQGELAGRDGEEAGISRTPVRRRRT